jgi:hypothetical protein
LIDEIFNTIPEGVGIVDINGHAFGNPKFLELFS